MTKSTGRKTLRPIFQNTINHSYLMSAHHKQDVFKKNNSAKEYTN